MLFSPPIRRAPNDGALTLNQAYDELQSYAGEYSTLRAPLAEWVSRQVLTDRPLNPGHPLIDDDRELAIVGTRADISRPATRRGEIGETLRHVIDSLDRLFALADPSAPLTPKYQWWMEKHRLPAESKGEYLLSSIYLSLKSLAPLAASEARIDDDRRNITRPLNRKEKRYLDHGSKGKIEKIVSAIHPAGSDEFPSRAIFQLINFVSFNLIRFFGEQYVAYLSRLQGASFQRDFYRARSLAGNSQTCF